MREKTDQVTSLLPALRRYALALARHESDADDLVQEALLRGHEKRLRFRVGGNLKSWLMGIMHNAFIDGKRQEQARRLRETAHFELQDLQISAPQEAALRLSQLRSAFFSLPTEQREALTLVAIEGMTYAAAARISDVPIGTLISRVARGRASLRAFENGTSQDKSAGGDERGTVSLKIIGGRDV